jgi:hypothetical protein
LSFCFLHVCIRQETLTISLFNSVIPCIALHVTQANSNNSTKLCNLYKRTFLMDRDPPPRSSTGFSPVWIWTIHIFLSWFSLRMVIMINCWVLIAKKMSLQKISIYFWRIGLNTFEYPCKFIVFCPSVLSLCNIWPYWN